MSDNFYTHWALSGVYRDISDDFGGRAAPKMKFNFTVQFILNRDLSLPYPGVNEMQDIMFQCKTATRPKISVEYKDANFYNFRTKVATKTNYGTASLSFYDDGKNLAHTILQNYLTTISPIASANEGASTLFDKNGFSSSASLGPLKERHGPITAIRVAHHYYHNGPKKITYSYINPKFTDIEFDEMDMATSDASTVSISFTYDTVNIKKE